MKLKKNLLIVGFLFVLVGFTLYNTQLYNEWNKGRLESLRNSIEYCETEDLGEHLQQYCEEAHRQSKENLSFFYVFQDIQLRGLGELSMFLPLGLLLVSLVYIYDDFNDKQIYKDIKKDGYKKTLRKTLKKGLLASFILPVLSIVVMVISYYFSKNFNPIAHASWSLDTMSNHYVFISLYLLYVWIHSIIYILIGIIVSRYSKKYTSAIMISYIVIFLLQLVSEVFQKVIHYSFLGILYFGDSEGLLITMLVPIGILIVVYMIVKIVYKNEDKFVKHLKRTN